ncbi:DedA family protein [Arenibaculum pallidiluteum]|uniref:DedA family protein n=1 Tax=Arenibaculum pallidiluteum TaxID=2812559 RepID=UPI001A95B8B3|nr:DedA family protein [Arenibaculum pallidiluteum]
MEITNWIQEYGSLYYLIVFVWTFLEGETFVIFSGVAAREGLLDLSLLITLAWAGSFLGDQTYFFIGRRYGNRLLKRFPRWKPGVDKALSLLERYSTGFILTFRFIYGVRNVSSFSIGMSTMSWPRFAVLNFIAAGIWATSFAGAGYFAGAALQHLLGDLAKGFGLVMLGVFLVVVVCVLKMARKPPATGAAETPAE